MHAIVKELFRSRICKQKADTYRRAEVDCRLPTLHYLTVSMLPVPNKYTVTADYPFSLSLHTSS